MRPTDFKQATRAFGEQVGDNRVNLAKLNYLTELDTLCAECVRGETMLCDGARLCFRTDSVGVAQFYMVACVRKQAREYEQHKSDALRFANLGAAKTQELLKNEKEVLGVDIRMDENGIFVDGREFPSFAYGEYGRDFTNYIKDFVFAFALHGVRAKYVLTLQLYRSEKISASNVYLNDDKLLAALATEVYDPEILVLDGLDVQGNKKIRSALLKCLRWRIDEMKPTVVSLASSVVASDNDEADLYEEISTWKKLEATK